MTGKEKCEFLRNIRKNIARLNGLLYEPHECHNEGDCLGYCPLCDKESAELMFQLDKKESAGLPINIDLESIKALEDMARTQSADWDEDDGDEETAGMPTPNPKILSQGINEMVGEIGTKDKC